MDDRRDCSNCHYRDEVAEHPVCARCLDQFGYEGTWAPIGSGGDDGRIPTVAEVQRFARHNPEAFEYIAAVLASERGDPA